jgi:hypothetical protein
MPAVAGTTGSIPLQGNIGSACTISVRQSGGSSLTLTATTTNLTVASAVEQCNDSEGYVVTAKSTSAASKGISTPELVGSSGNSDFVTYSLIYNGTTATFDNTGVAQVTNVSSRAVQGTTKTVAITYTGVTTLGADTYSDTLIFTILGK